MKFGDIDHLLGLMAAEATEQGNDSLKSGAISLKTDTYTCAFPRSS